MKPLSIHSLMILTLVASGLSAADKPPATRPVTRCVVVFDFACKDGKVGRQLADSVRLRLRRHKGYEVVDRLTTQDATGPQGVNARDGEILKLLNEKFTARSAIYGTVHVQGGVVRAQIVFLDVTEPAKPVRRVKVFSDDTQRARAVISRAVVEAVTGRADWKPPEYGDEPEPKKFARPLNLNGAFEDGAKGWDRPDNVSTFLEAGPKGRGKILRVRTDLARDPWLKYRRALRLGRADPGKPPRIPQDTGYSSVAGLEGVHYRSEFIKATPGMRYWLLTDHKGQGGAKVFVKGFRKTPHALDGLPESSLAEMAMTPRQFAALPAARRKAIIAADAKKHPKRYLRECYRWYLNCAAGKGAWKHFAAPFPPRGGLPKNVEWLQIQIYSYWPAGEYLWDNVHLYADPRQKAPLPVGRPTHANRRAGRRRRPETDLHLAHGAIDV